MAIDLHAHWIPPALAQALRRRRAVPRIEENSAGEWFVTYQARRRLAPLVDLDARRALMDRHGVAMQLLSLGGLMGVDCLPAEESLPLVRAFNEETAAACREHSRRFAAIAALPLADMALACRELARAHDLGLRGAILPADGFTSLATAERFRPLFGTGDRLRSHFFIHPGPVVPQPERPLLEARADHAWQRRIVLETQARLSEAVVTLELSDYLDPYPNVTVQIANLGGAIPFLIERMDAVSRGQAADESPPSARLRRCYIDTASFGPRAITLAAACFGPERIVLGTDCPMFEIGRMLESVAEARFDAQTRALLLSGNALRLLGLRPALSHLAGP